MSYILQALKRSEQDRSRIQAPEAYLNYERDLESDSRRRRFRWIVVGMLGLNVLLIAGLAWYFNTRAAAPRAEQASAATPPVAPATTSQQSAGTSPEPALQVPPAEPKATPPAPSALVDTLQPGYDASIRPLSSQAITPAPKPRISAPPPARVVYEPVATPGSAEVQPFVPPEIAALIAAENASANTSAEPTAASGGDVRGITLNVHVYSKNPKERFVFINGRKTVEGDTLDDMGTKLDAITPEGAILDLGYEKKLLRIETAH